MPAGWGGVEDKVTSVGTNILVNSLRACAYVILAGIVNIGFMEHF